MRGKRGEGEERGRGREGKGEEGRWEEGED